VKRAVTRQKYIPKGQEMMYILDTFFLYGTEVVRFINPKKPFLLCLKRGRVITPSSNLMMYVYLIYKNEISSEYCYIDLIVRIINPREN
jgi:hypothetical protein